MDAVDRDHIRSVQHYLLTHFKIGMEENGAPILNTFFGMSTDYIRENSTEAKRMYDMIFREFLYAWSCMGRPKDVVLPGLDLFLEEDVCDHA